MNLSSPVLNRSSQYLYGDCFRFIINPKAGRGNKEGIEKIIRKCFGNYEIFYTKAPGHATKLAEEGVKLGCRSVVAVGGDGTVNEVGKALIGTGCPMGIVPAGSGNDLAKYLKIPLKADKALESLKRFKKRTIDTVEVNGERFLGSAGLGFDALISQKFSQYGRAEHKSYVGLILREYPKYRPQEYKLQVDGKSLTKEALMVSFANISQYGNSIKIAPGAKADDGKLNLVLFAKPAWWRLPLDIVRLSLGWIHHSPSYETLACRKVVVKGEGEMLAHVDGEPKSFSEQVEVKIDPQSLVVLT
jgi:diacylglycerol kinase (ATP)